MANYLPKNRFDMLMSWIKTAAPDQWHQVADGWNWDDGEEVLRWIVEQPDCDKATALLVFWRGSPEYYWSEASDREGLVAAEAMGLDVYDMLVAINRRWKTSGFNRAELSYDPTEDWGANAKDVARSANHPLLAITTDMIEPLIGREIEYGDYDGGIPIHIVNATVEHS